MERVILHSDANCFYASVEMLHRPEYRTKPMAVGGDPGARHGIVLTANYIAKRAGVKTGQALWEAKQACPDIIFVPPRMDLYLRFTQMMREMYQEYTDRIEPFGCDESWLDVTESCSLKGDGIKIANELNRRVREELGITVSVGVSFNKIFAKLGSDYKKPDAVTTMLRDEYRKKIWPLPATDLLYVGRRTGKKLLKLGITTIGGLAQTDERILEQHFGKIGLVLWTFANGLDTTPVRREDAHAVIKSIGNSLTTPRDLLNDEDVKMVLYLLSESVASRLRKHGFRARTVEVSVRDNGLFSFTRQHKISFSTCSASEIAEEAFRIFRANYTWQQPIRSIGVRGCDLVTEQYMEQLTLFTDAERREKEERAERAVDDLRRRFGYYSVQRGLMLKDGALSHVNAEEDHTVHPVGYLYDL